LFTFTVHVEIARHFTRELSGDEPDVGILQSLASVQGLLMTIVNLQVQCPVLLLVWLQLELVRDDPRNTVLMMPPPISHYSLEGDGPRER